MDPTLLDQAANILDTLTALAVHIPGPWAAVAVAAVAAATLVLRALSKKAKAEKAIVAPVETLPAFGALTDVEKAALKAKK